jgi:hypothetical protein
LLVIAGACGVWPRRTRAVEVVLGIFFLLVALAEGGRVFSGLRGSEGYLASVLLAGMAFGSLLVGSPFTLPYAKEMTPVERWGNPHFLWVNQLLTGLWGCAFLACAGLGYWAGWRPVVILGVCGVIMFSAGWVTRWFPGWYLRNVFREGETEAPRR